MLIFSCRWHEIKTSLRKIKRETLITPEKIKLNTPLKGLELNNLLNVSWWILDQTKKCDTEEDSRIAMGRESFNKWRVFLIKNFNRD